jgi:hypothetical protein
MDRVFQVWIAERSSNKMSGKNNASKNQGRKGGNQMANCAEMKKGDVFVCNSCGLQLEVVNPCTCGTESGEACSVPLKCCNQDMTKK